MSIFIRQLEDIPIGKYTIDVFFDPVTNTKRIMVDKSYLDESGRVVGEYPMYDFEKVTIPGGDLISRDLLTSRAYYSPSVGLNLPLSEVKKAPAIIKNESDDDINKINKMIFDLFGDGELNND